MECLATSGVCLVRGSRPCPSGKSSSSVPGRAAIFSLSWGRNRSSDPLSKLAYSPRKRSGCFNGRAFAAKQVAQEAEDSAVGWQLTSKTAQLYDLERRTVYLVDVHPLCYEGKKPRPTAVLNWMKLLFDQVSHADPVIAVMDGERGNDYRRGLLPTYKEKRNKYKPLSGIRGPYFKGDELDLREAFPCIQAFLTECNVRVLKIEDAEADDVIATLTQQALNKGMRVVVASPDMDYRQLLCEDVNMALPLPEFGRWSFYTLQQYIAEHDCDPSLDLGLRCMLGDHSDNVPGLPELAPGFGRKTALKLMKKHGSLENLLLAAKTRTVGRPYIQEALTKFGDALYRNLQVLSLRRDVNITLDEEWCRPRDRSNEAQAFKRLRECLQDRR